MRRRYPPLADFVHLPNPLVSKPQPDAYLTGKVAGGPVLVVDLG